MTLVMKVRIFCVLTTTLTFYVVAIYLFWCVGMVGMAPKAFRKILGEFEVIFRL